MSEKLVSVCMPCRNAARYVGAALDSVLAQTWRNLEIIVVDDASTDGSADVLAKYETQGVTVLRANCGSAARARNLAFQASRGEYIKYLDADDLINPDCIEVQVRRVDATVGAVAFSAWGRFFQDDLGTFRLSPQSVWRDLPPTQWLVESWATARPMMQPGMFLFHRALHDEVGPWNADLTLIDDFEFFTRLLCVSTQLCFTPDARLYYRSGLDQSLSTRKDRTAVESAFRSLQLGTNHLLEQRDDAAARRACANMLKDFIYTHYPDHSDLRAKIAHRIAELGGSDLPPSGPPRFEHLRRVVGWKIARRIQRLAGR